MGMPTNSDCFAFIAADSATIRLNALHSHCWCSYGHDSVCSMTSISGPGAVTFGLWLASSS
jgi:hypothetical protein